MRQATGTPIQFDDLEAGDLVKLISHTGGPFYCTFREIAPTMDSGYCFIVDDGGTMIVDTRLIASVVRFRDAEEMLEDGE